MVVKEKRGRYRYIIFRGEGIKKREIYNLMKSSGMKLKMAFYQGNYFIIKCRHLDKENVLDYFNTRGKGKLKSIKTSGTIKKLKRYINNS